MLTDIQLLQIKNAMKRVLHVPGNYTGGILEMAVVTDYCIPGEELEELTWQIANGLKRQDETFRNVRLNLIKWVSDECIVKEVSSLTMLQMKRGFEDYSRYVTAKANTDFASEVFADFAAEKSTSEESVVYESERISDRKSVDELFRQLKLFYARSKIILVITNGDFIISDKEMVNTYLHPFLGRKMLFLNRGKRGSFSIERFSAERLF